ncbi:hypothetical protein [Halostagnicola bangensis]
MNRAALGSVLAIGFLLPGAWIGSEQTITVPIPAGLSITAEESVVVGVPELIFVGIPTLFVAFMLIEATGHVRERKPPS